MKKLANTLGTVALLTAAVSTTLAALPDPGMQIEKGRTALVVTDPQNDFLSPKGVTWGVVGKNVINICKVFAKNYCCSDRLLPTAFSAGFLKKSGSVSHSTRTKPSTVPKSRS